jgi:hypothetical protein
MMDCSPLTLFVVSESARREEKMKNAEGGMQNEKKGKSKSDAGQMGLL